MSAEDRVDPECMAKPKRPPRRDMPARMEPYTPEWERMANRMAREFCPRLYPCADCGGPVVKGYCCRRCGSSNPEGH
jgi:hypothetical protein